MQNKIRLCFSFCFLSFYVRVIEHLHLIRALCDSSGAEMPASCTLITYKGSYFDCYERTTLRKILPWPLM